MLLSANNLIEPHSVRPNTVIRPIIPRLVERVSIQQACEQPAGRRRCRAQDSPGSRGLDGLAIGEQKASHWSRPWSWRERAVVLIVGVGDELRARLLPRSRAPPGDSPLRHPLDPPCRLAERAARSGRDLPPRDGAPLLTVNSALAGCRPSRSHRVSGEALPPLAAASFAQRGLPGRRMPRSYSASLPQTPAADQGSQAYGSLACLAFAGRAAGRTGAIVHSGQWSGFGRSWHESGCTASCRSPTRR